MILDKMREKFLIIGFTGPLRSGCTTAACFLEKELQKDAEKAKNEISKCQNEIKEIYSKISGLKEKKNNPDNDDKLWDLRKKLLEKIKMRKICNVLAKYNEDSPIYISMTDMLLKTAIEYYWSHKNKKIVKAVGQNRKQEENNYYFILEQIKQNFKHIDDIVCGKNCINNLIRERKYHKLKQNKIDIYEKYLKNISEFRKNLPKVSKANGGEVESLGMVLQDMGDNIRSGLNPFDSTIPYNGRSESLWKLSEQANDVIKFYKNRYRFISEEDKQKEFQKSHIFIIENFRNPVEAEYFRLRYYEFFLISVHCNKQKRIQREYLYNRNSIYKLLPLTSKDREKEFSKIDERDSGKKIKEIKDLSKQNVSDTVDIADIAIINETNTDDFKKKLLKYYILIRYPGIFHPSNNELFMHIAYSMSLRSKCIGRKVGAVIVGEKGYIIGAGWNEVGEGLIGCGDRIIQDIIDDKGHNNIPIEMESKDDFRNYLLNKYKSKLNHSFCFRSEYVNHVESVNGGENAIVKAQQYCRALHAEENAIIQTAKIGGVGVRNGTMYTTTFPCELCAKKIYQSKIKKIVYTEPYPEAISEAVFLKDGLRPVLIEPFEGVKSNSYYRLYKPVLDVKDVQSLEDVQN